MFQLSESLETVAGGLLEGPLYSIACLGADFETGDAVFECKGGEFILCDLQILAIGLVADDYELDILLRVLLDFVHPELLNVLECFPDSEVEHEDDTLCIFVICTSNGPESFLSGSVPDLQLNGLVIKLQRSD